MPQALDPESLNVVLTLMQFSCPVLFAQNPAYNLAPIVLIIIVGYFLLFLPNKRKEQEHRRLLDNLKKDDRVVTIGGIYGVVANVKRDADRVTLKIDEANNTKIDVTFGSIARVVAEEPAGDKPAR